MANLSTTYALSGGAWSRRASMPDIKISGHAPSSGRFQSGFLSASGSDNSAVTQTSYFFNGGTWATITAYSLAARQNLGGANFNNFFYAMHGRASGADLADGAKWNGSVWGSATAIATRSFMGMAKLTGSNVLIAGFGFNSAAAAVDQWFSYTTGESAGSITASGTAALAFNVFRISGRVFKARGSTTNSNTTVIAAVLAWDGASWAAQTNYPIASWNGGVCERQASATLFGGQEVAGGLLSSSFSFDGVTYIATSNLLVASTNFGGAGGIV